MEFRILGPLEVLDDDGAIALRGAKPRALMAVLLLNANEPVSSERLAVALWGEEAPASAAKTVQVHVSRLRKSLGDSDILTTTPAGYRLRVLPGELDAERFAQLVEEGRRELLSGHPERASAALRDGLALWRGPPLADLEFEAFAQPEISRLEEQRLVALEARADAELAAGRHVALVGELQRLARLYPSRERFAGQLMLALYRSDRQTEALAAYRDARQALVETSGIEPGPELRRLHEAILRQDPALRLPPASELPPELDASRAPALAGREDEVADLLDRWERARGGHGAVVTISGEHGIGKTRLTMELAGEVHRLGALVLYASGLGAAGASTGSSRRHARRLHRCCWSSMTSIAPGLPCTPSCEGWPRVWTRCRSWSWPAGSDVERSRPKARSDSPSGRSVLTRSRRSPPPTHVTSPTRTFPWSGCSSAAEALRCVSTRPQASGRATRRNAGSARSPEGPRKGACSCARWRPSWPAGSWTCRQSASAPRRRRRDPVVCPFKGLAAFDTADAEYYFGRERLVAELVARIVGAPLLGIVGPSGSGKSSVLRAGLLPALAGGVLPGSDTGAGRSSGPASIRFGAEPRRRAASAARRWCSPSTSSRRRSRPAGRGERTRSSARSSAARDARERRRRARHPRGPVRALRRVSGAVGAAGGQPRARHADAARRVAARDRAAGPARRPGSSPGWPMRSSPTSRASPARCRCSRRRCSSSGSGATAGALRLAAYEQPAACAARSPASPRTPSPASTRRSRRSRAACSCGWSRRRRGRRRAPPGAARRARDGRRGVAPVVELFTDRRLLTVSDGKVESRTRRCCASGRGCAAGSRRTARACGSTAA